MSIEKIEEPEHVDTVDGFGNMLRGLEDLGRAFYGMKAVELLSAFAESLEDGSIERALEKGLEAGSQLLELIEDNREMLEPALEAAMSLIAPDLGLTLQDLERGVGHALDVISGLKERYDALSDAQKRQLLTCLGESTKAVALISSGNYAAGAVSTLNALIAGATLIESLDDHEAPRGVQETMDMVIDITPRDEIEMQAEMSD